MIAFVRDCNKGLLLHDWVFRLGLGRKMSANGITYCKDEKKFKMEIGAFLDKCRHVIQCLSNSWNNLEIWSNTTITYTLNFLKPYLDFVGLSQITKGKDSILVG